MRAAAASCALLGLWLGACGFPDYGFDHSPLTSKGGAAGGDSFDASHDSGIGGRAGTGGETQGGGGQRAKDAGLDGRTGCLTNGDCAGSLAGTLCDTTDGQCVECRPGRGDCGRGTWCTPIRLCELGCEGNIDCVGAPSLPGDGTDAGKRDASASSSDASRDASPSTDAGDAGTRTATCDLGSHTCAGCRTDAQCPSGFTCDVGARHCVLGCNATRACPQGFTCCAGQCENLTRSASHCGSCGNSCERDAGLGACVNGACRLDACRPGFGDCNGDPKDGCEADFGTDPNHCGSCEGACALPRNASAACVGGACALGPCQPNFANCDGDPATACEVNLGFNTSNCGTCGFACNLLNANQRCEAAACTITTCRAGFADCDQITSTGCEVNTQSDPSNCGACGKVCSFPDADARCQAGTCRLGPCLGGAADCNAKPADGCEVNTSNDVANCGACAHPCALPHSTPTCTDGSCEIAKCDPGYGDCNGIATDGCETNLDTSAANCSVCGKACSANHATTSCALGACSISCASGFDDCDGDSTNGCETDTTSNVEHCGGCNGVCSTTGGTPNCVNGNCGLSACSGSLADCNASSSDGCEVNTASDVNNCGGCGKTCFVANGTPKCVGASCVISTCKAGFSDCNTDASDGCETRLNTLKDCGACGKACTAAHANASCVTGSCQIASCLTPFADCDGVASNGCETDVSKDTKNCGGCANACNSTNGTANCLNGSCTIACNTGFANCNAAVSDGCEKATKNDVANCGACGAVCAVQNGTPACTGTTCTVASCAAPFADCDHLYATGCEVNTNTNINNCGGCGKACDTSRGTPTCAAGVCSTP